MRGVGVMLICHTCMIGVMIVMIQTPYSLKTTKATQGLSRKNTLQSKKKLATK